MKQFDLKAYMDVTPEIEEAVRTGKPYPHRSVHIRADHFHTGQFTERYRSASI